MNRIPLYLDFQTVYMEPHLSQFPNPQHLKTYLSRWLKSINQICESLTALIHYHGIVFKLSHIIFIMSSLEEILKQIEKLTLWIFMDLSNLWNGILNNNKKIKAQSMYLCFTRLSVFFIYTNNRSITY